MRALICGILVGVLGCGDDGGTNTPTDASPDALPDAPPDAPLVDAPPPPVGHQHYVISQLRVPTSNPEAQAFGLDLDNDQTVDNQLGMVLSTFATMGFPIQEGYSRAIDQGTSITLVDLVATDLMTAATATLALFKGTNAMPSPCNGAADLACRRHLAGTGTFTAAATPVHAPLAGAIIGNTLTAGPGQLTIDLVFNGSTPVAVTLIGARVQASTISQGGIGNLILAGAISQTDITGTVIPAMRDGYAARVAVDCTALTSPPTCGCAGGSDGATYLSLFDTAPKDCAISLAEVRDNSLIQSLLAPDVTINNVNALSIGVRATAVPAGFVAP